MIRHFSRTFSHKVGFIGLGNMGQHMTRNLVASGFKVKGFDISEQAREAASKNGVTPVDSIAEAAKDVDYIVTALPKGEHVDSVLHQKGGVYDSASPNTFICDTSTISPYDSKRFAENAAKNSMTFVDSPMSGGVLGAERGTLTFMVGANSENDYEKAKTVLSGMGKNFFHCGEVGTGEVAKVCNNMMLGIQMVAVAEGFALGKKLGIDEKKLNEICAVSTSGCWTINNANPVPGVHENSAATNEYKGGF